MVLPRLRRASRAVVFVLLASFWGLSHRAGDDSCFGGRLQGHDEATYVVGTSDGAAPDHCAVCHSVRTPRRPFGSAPQLQSPLVEGLVVVRADGASRRAPALNRLPARAPPASLT